MATQQVVTTTRDENNNIVVRAVVHVAQVQLTGAELALLRKQRNRTNRNLNVYAQARIDREAEARTR